MENRMMRLVTPTGANRMNINPFQEACEEEWLTQEKPCIPEREQKSSKTSTRKCKNTLYLYM